MSIFILQAAASAFLRSSKPKAKTKAKAKAKAKASALPEASGTESGAVPAVEG